MDNEKRLIQKARTDKNAFLDLYEHYFPKIFGYLLIRTKDRELAEDVAQETFLKAIRALKNYEDKGRSFGAWLFKIAHNELVSRWREGRRVSYQPPEQLERIGELSELAEEKLVFGEVAEEKEKKFQLIERALEKMSSSDRELILLKYISDFSYQEIAKIYKRSPNALAVQLHRALKNLKQLINS